MIKKLIIVFTLFPQIGFYMSAQNSGSEFSALSSYIQTLKDFSGNIPQEKVYLHFDNTGYYQGDNIWFKCYVVTSEQHRLSDLSKTLYVELLNSDGEIVDKRTLKVENGQCHGEFRLNQLPFFSGFYEVRAYTKYMLNFGDDVIFSRILPVFDKPKTEGNYEEKAMLKYSRWGTGNYSKKRKYPVREKQVNLRFFPEGGNLIQGVASRVAFEATDEVGNPIAVTGVVMDADKQELCPITTLHDGKGVFTYTPGGGRRRDVAEVEYSGKKYAFDLPTCLPQGVTMEVDNLSHPDSIGITLRKTKDVPAEMLGVVILSGGKLQNYCFAWMEEEQLNFKMNKTRLPAGVSQIVLFNDKGEILCDRLIFSGMDERLAIQVHTNKPAYRPYELVDMEISVTDRDANPVNASFSLSVRDGANEVEHNRNILTDLLLMSEIKGYVRNPTYYFENDDEKRRAALDVLLMVQGWRRYAWKQMAGIEPFEIKNLPEQGIETNGQVVSMVRQIPQPNVDVSLMLFQKGIDEIQPSSSFFEIFVTDQQGRFAFTSDVLGRWNMILSTREKRKMKDHRILLDRIFDPEPRQYNYSEMQVNIAEINSESLPDKDTLADIIADDDLFLIAYHDSLAKLGINEKVHQLEEVVVTAKRRTREEDIFHSRSTSVVYYDVASEADNIYDRGIYVGKSVNELIKNMNPYFTVLWAYTNGTPTKIAEIHDRHRGTSAEMTVGEGILREYPFYKGRPCVFVINYEPVYWNDIDPYNYALLDPSAIKNIYINETTTEIARYILSANPTVSPMEIADLLGCAVFIETYPEEEMPVEGAKGVRKTWLEGYSPVMEFYSPNYAELPPVADYRRTLYWNPMVISDEFGKANIQFYNNSSCKNFSISAEAITPLGMMGIYKK